MVYIAYFVSLVRVSRRPLVQWSKPWPRSWFQVPLENFFQLERSVLQTSLDVKLVIGELVFRRPSMVSRIRPLVPKHSTMSVVARSTIRTALRGKKSKKTAILVKSCGRKWILRSLWKLLFFLTFWLLTHALQSKCWKQPTLIWDQNQSPNFECILVPLFPVFRKLGMTITWKTLKIWRLILVSD